MRLIEKYPEGFDMGILSDPFTNYGDKKRYLDMFFPVLGEGSSRRVYGVDEKRVIKLAINNKGLAQNEAEISFGKMQYAVCARIINYDKQNYFIESERATPLEDSDGDIFEYYTDIPDIRGWFRNFLEYNSYGILSKKDFRLKYSQRFSSASGAYSVQALEELISFYDNPWVMDLIKFALRFNYVLPGDFPRLSTYGVVERRNIEGSGKKWSVVLVDYGFTEDISRNHY